MNSKQALALVSLQCGKNFLKSERIARLFMPSIYRTIRRSITCRYPSKSCSYRIFKKYRIVLKIILDMKRVQEIIKENLEEDGFNVVISYEDIFDLTYPIINISWGN